MINIVKVGGSTLRTQQDFVHLVERLRAIGEVPTVVVLSALPQVTRQLERAALIAERGDLQTATELVRSVAAQHRQLAQTLIGEAHTTRAFELLVDELEQRILRALQGTVLTGELTPRTLDRITSTGERMALHLVHHVLQEHGLESITVPGTDLIVTSDVHGNATPLYWQTTEAVQRRLMPLLEPGTIVLTEGFVGATADGHVTTMGKESSTLTAALLATITGATTLVFYTPVAGIHSVDPLLVPSAQPIRSLTYDHAEALAYAGLKLLYPTMIAPLRERNIELHIAALNPRALSQTNIGAVSVPDDAFVMIVEMLHGVELSRDNYRRALTDGWQHYGIATDYGAHITTGARDSEIATLDHLGVPYRSLGECWQIRVWAYARQLCVHQHIGRTIAQLPSLGALAMSQHGDTSITSVITWSLEPPVLDALHAELVQEFPHGHA
jgi:aspartate kinase